MSADDLLFCRRHLEHHPHIKIAAIEHVLNSPAIINRQSHTAMYMAKQCPDEIHYRSVE